jgi:hypothetical protein
MFPGNGSTVDIPLPLGSSPLFTDSRKELTWSPQLSSLYLLLTDQIENPVSKIASNTARRFATLGTCSLSRCLETGLLYLPISRSSHCNGSTRYSSIRY